MYREKELVSQAIAALSLPPVKPAADYIEEREDELAQSAAIYRISSATEKLKFNHDDELLSYAFLRRLTPHLGNQSSKLDAQRVNALISSLDNQLITSTTDIDPLDKIVVTTVTHRDPESDTTTSYRLKNGRITDIHTQHELESVDARYVYDKEGRVVKVNLEKDSGGVSLPEKVELMLGHEDGVLSQPLCRRIESPANNDFYFRLGSIDPKTIQLQEKLQSMDVPGGILDTKYAKLIVKGIKPGDTKQFVEYQPENL